MNRKGFTLIELIATIVVLALVTSIVAYSITGVLKRSKQQLHERLVDDIKNAAELYYQECKYSNNDGVTCNGSGGVYTTTLGDLVNYGYLTGNGTDNNDKYTLVDPNDDKINLSDCEISVTFASGSILVTSTSSNTKCPTY